jgi:predicted kinase
MAKKIAQQKNAKVYSIDDYWEWNDGQKRFDPEYLNKARKLLFKKCEQAIKDGQSIVVDSYNLNKKEIEPYTRLSKEFKTQLVKLVAPKNNEDIDYLEYYNRNNVPYHVILSMREKWEDIE